MDFEQTVEPDVTNNYSEDEPRYSNSEYARLTYPEGTGDVEEEGDTRVVTTVVLSEDKLTSKVKMTTNNYNWKLVPGEKKINHEKFLGLWENETGEYSLGCLFKQNGKKVGYSLPEEEDTLKYPIDDIPSDNGQNINILLGLLRHEDTQMHEELMMYFWNKYMGEDIYDVNLEGLVDFFSTEITTNIGAGYGTIAINGCNIDREDFISLIQNSKFNSTFKQNAGIIYDICKSNNINPILCASVGAHESGYGKNVPSNSPYNYWGIGVYNNTNTGTSFSSMEEAVKYWCNLIKKYQTPGSSSYSMIVERSRAFQAVNGHYSGGVNNIYDIWSIYAYLGDDHKSKVYGNVNVKEYITRYLKEITCNHGLNDPTTTEEKAAYIVNYVDNGIVKIAKDIFGSKAVGGDAAGVVQFALGLVGQSHDTFTNYYHVKSNWCAMFVSYCYEKCGLIPSVLPSSYLKCSDEVRSLRSKGLFRERSSGYIPKAGDIIFFVGTTDISGHTGIVTDCDGINVYTVEGNAGPTPTGDWRGRKVTQKSYSLSSARIVGYFES